MNSVCTASLREVTNVSIDGRAFASGRFQVRLGLHIAA